MPLTNCATHGLEPYVPSAEMPWDVARVQHLYRRAGFGATPAEIEAALTAGPAATVSQLLNGAAQRALRPEPSWAGLDHAAMQALGLEQFDAFTELYYAYVDEAIRYGVREKLSLFWQSHLVTIYETHGCADYQRQYLGLSERMAFGSFRELVRAMTKTPAMLFFLNGFENTRENPNENYARELFELFTLGENNGYTQQDIVEASRALTGYNGWTTYCGGLEWAAWGFDDSDKTVFGVTANLNTDSLIDLLFTERAEEISRFICGKLYRFYVNVAPDEAVISGLAETLRTNDWQLLPVLIRLFSSAHFFDGANVGVLVKSPLEVMISFLRQGDFGDFESRLGWGIWACANMGQYVGHPPDVAGWGGNRAWIDSNRLTLRWEFLDGFAWAVHNESEDTYPTFAKLLTGNSNSPEVIARALADYFVPRGLLTEDAYALATDVLKWDVPENYYTTGQWNLDFGSASWQITLLLQHLGRLPEFQLT